MIDDKIDREKVEENGGINMGDIYYYIGIDASLTSTGIIVLDKHGKLYSRNIVKSDLRGTDRLIDLSNKTEEFLLNFLPASKAFVFLENYSFGSRVGQAFSIGEWGGALRILLRKLDLKFSVIPPTVLKKFVTGKGNAKKEQMLLQTYKKFGEEFSSNDECDAYGLAMVGYSFFNKDKLELSKADKELLKKIKV